MNIKYSTTFQKQYKKAPISIQKKIKERLELLLRKPTSPVLRNHALTGQLQGRRSINITGDWRVVYSIRITHESKKEYYIELVGTHSQLYK